MTTLLKITSLVALASVAVFSGAAALAQSEFCSSPLSPAIANSCIVSKDVLWRGAKPDALGAAELISLGVKTIVNLELLHDDKKTFRTARPKTVLSPAIEYFRIRDWEPNVVVANDRLDSNVAEFIAIARTQPKPIYVHCRSGQNRTGVMVAAYRVLVEDWSNEAAIDEMKRYQGIWHRQDAEYLRSLTGERRTRIEKMSEKNIGRIKRNARLDCSTTGCNEAK